MAGLDFSIADDAPYGAYVMRVAARFEAEAGARFAEAGYPALRLDFAYLGLVQAIAAFNEVIPFAANPKPEPLLTLERDVDASEAEAVLRGILGYWLWLICSEGNGKTRLVWGTPGEEFYRDVAGLWLLTDAERQHYRALDEVDDEAHHPHLLMQWLVERAGGDLSKQNYLTQMSAALRVKNAGDELIREFAGSLG